ncbi:hypothetical protein DY000_02000829 [Brassica cretica]|uniref:FACT complex subunit SSRP1 n=1 Tax=Brassica cretica TaxID=69181 RepID=A0ABQ7BVM1_BRACR|nr:hypothetical protein DY000_02000829 [Brassica cretica]
MVMFFGNNKEFSVPLRSSVTKPYNLILSTKGTRTHHRFRYSTKRQTLSVNDDDDDDDNGDDDDGDRDERAGQDDDGHEGLGTFHNWRQKSVLKHLLV